MRLLLLCLLLSACGVVNYDDIEPGEFKGSLLVMWVGEGGPSGSGRFVYVPAPGNPLTFTRKSPGISPRIIEPDMMYTDGGSIPRQAQLFSGFSPWGYAPAYMVHDWIFVARHCRTDGTPTDQERRFSTMTFQDSADLIAEAIKALITSGHVKEREVAPRIISGAVAGPISYNRWTVRGACAGDRLTQAHKDEVDAALAKRDGKQLLVAAPPADIVAELEF